MAWLPRRNFIIIVAAYSLLSSQISYAQSDVTINDQSPGCLDVTAQTIGDLRELTISGLPFGMNITVRGSADGSIAPSMRLTGPQTHVTMEKDSGNDAYIGVQKIGVEATSEDLAYTHEVPVEILLSNSLEADSRNKFYSLVRWPSKMRNENTNLKDLFFIGTLEGDARADCISFDEPLGQGPWTGGGKSHLVTLHDGDEFIALRNQYNRLLEEKNQLLADKAILEESLSNSESQLSRSQGVASKQSEQINDCLIREQTLQAALTESNEQFVLADDELERAKSVLSRVIQERDDARARSDAFEDVAKKSLKRMKRAANSIIRGTADKALDIMVSWFDKLSPKGSGKDKKSK